MLSKINIIHRRVNVIFFCLFLFIALQMLVSLFTHTSLEIVRKIVLHQSLNATLVGLKIYLDLLLCQTLYLFKMFQFMLANVEKNGIFCVLSATEV